MNLGRSRSWPIASTACEPFPLAGEPIVRSGAGGEHLAEAVD
jgi:hypothetical protein